MTRLLKKWGYPCTLLGIAFLTGILFQNCSKFPSTFQQDFASQKVASSTAEVFKGRILMGDMLVNVPENGPSKNEKAIGYATYRSSRWPGGKVFIDVETHAVPMKLVTLLKEACTEWTHGSKAECIFVKPNQVKHPLFVTNFNLGCWASLGYNTTVSHQRTYANQMNMEGYCFTKHDALHEMGHVFGLIHEHQRFDRDSYIEVDMNNIRRDSHAFDKIGALLDLKNYSKKYDIDSIMHYGQFTAANIDISRPAYTIKTGGTNYGFQTFLSAEDKTAIAEIYGHANAPSSNEVIGYIDGISAGRVVNGWLCNKGIAKSIAYHIYAGAPGKPGDIWVGGGAGNLRSEPQVVASCGVNSGSYRFSYTLPPETVGKSIHIFGISESGDNKNNALSRSGTLVVPTPTPTPPPAPECQHSVEQANNDSALEWHCGCNKVPNVGNKAGWVKQADGCFHKEPSYFCANKKKVYFTCDTKPKGRNWNRVSDSCYHLGTNQSCR